VSSHHGTMIEQEDLNRH